MKFASEWRCWPVLCRLLSFVAFPRSPSRSSAPSPASAWWLSVPCEAYQRRRGQSHYPGQCLSPQSRPHEKTLRPKRPLKLQKKFKREMMVSIGTQEQSISSHLKSHTQRLNHYFHSDCAVFVIHCASFLWLISFVPDHRLSETVKVNGFWQWG